MRDCFLLEQTESHPIIAAIARQLRWKMAHDCVFTIVASEVYQTYQITSDPTEEAQLMAQPP